MGCTRLCAPFFSSLGPERRQTQHPGSPEDQFCESRDKGNLPASARPGLPGTSHGSTSPQGGPLEATAECDLNDPWWKEEPGVLITVWQPLLVSSVPMHRSCWDTNGEQGYLWMPSSGRVDAWHAPPCGSTCTWAHNCSQPTRYPLPPSLQCHLLSFGSFFYPVHPPSSIFWWSRPWASAEGSLWSQAA